MNFVILILSSFRSTGSSGDQSLIMRNFNIFTENSKNTFTVLQIFESDESNKLLVKSKKSDYLKY